MESSNWKWRDGEMSVRDFYKLSSTAKQEYIQLLEQLDAGTRSTGDNILLNLYSKKVSKHFISLDDDE